ncbi:MAG: putative MarR family transcriptional regulator [Ilumatobacteraceae bacterium]|nr:putative MarR family transcriptional regulator [Ilumatobacteraceae bacterium]
MPRLDAERIALWRRLGRVIVDVQREIDGELGEAHGLPLAWFDAMSAIRDGGGRLRVGELCDTLGDVVSSVSRRLDRMEDAGLVERSVAPVGGDRRSVSVALTAAGRAMWREANITYRRLVQHRFASRLTDTDVAALQRVLTKTSRN